MGLYYKEERLEISVRTNHKGKPEISVYGNGKNTPQQIAKAFKETVAELNRKEKK